MRRKQLKSHPPTTTLCTHQFCLLVAAEAEAEAVRSAATSIGLIVTEVKVSGTVAAAAPCALLLLLVVLAPAFSSPTLRVTPLYTTFDVPVLSAAEAVVVVAEVVGATGPPSARGWVRGMGAKRAGSVVRSN